MYTKKKRRYIVTGKSFIKFTVSGVKRRAPAIGSGIYQPRMKMCNLLSLPQKVRMKRMKHLFFKTNLGMSCSKTRIALLETRFAPLKPDLSYSKPEMRSVPKLVLKISEENDASCVYLPTRE